MNTHSIRFRLTVWYAGLLAGLVILFSASVYFGLGRYLEWTLRESLARQARQMGETYLANVHVSGEAYVVDEINEHFAPELNNRLARVTRKDGSTRYASGAPGDRSFDPSQLPPAPTSVGEPSAREVRLAGVSGLLVYTLPFHCRGSLPAGRTAPGHHPRPARRVSQAKGRATRRAPREDFSRQDRCA